MSSDDDQYADVPVAEPDDERVWTPERRRWIRRYRAHTPVTGSTAPLSREFCLLHGLLNRMDWELRVTVVSLQRYLAHHWP